MAVDVSGDPGRTVISITIAATAWARVVRADVDTGDAAALLALGFVLAEIEGAAQEFLK